MSLDSDFVRAQFPAFSEPSLDGFGFFENAGGSYACGAVTERLHRYYRQTKVQPYYPYPASLKAGEEMDSARHRMAAWLNVKSEEVHFGPSTTQNTYVLAQALRQHLAPGDEVIVTNQDHEANIGAWRRLADMGIIIREWLVDPETAELNPAGLDALLGARTKAVAFTHCSNVVASINPVREITDRIHAAGALAIVDGVSFCPHGLPDIPALGADIYLFSLYKVYGTHLGVMFMREAVNAELPNQGHFFNAGKPGARFTPAGPDHGQIAASNGVIDYFETLYQHHHTEPSAPADMARAVSKLLRSQESRVVQPLLDFLQARPGVRLVGRLSAEERAPTVTFTVKKHASNELAVKLAQRKLGVGTGHFYAYRLCQALGFDLETGAVRASLVHYNTAAEVSRLIEALDELI